MKINGNRIIENIKNKFMDLIFNITAIGYFIFFWFLCNVIFRGKGGN